MLYSTQ